jgi:hypothetical protein
MKKWSFAEIRQLLISLWPDGQLYDWYTPTSFIYRFLDSIAEVLRAYGYDLLDQLRGELNPATCVQKLSDWERALGLTTSYAATAGTTAQRQTGVLSRLREFGAFTNANCRAIIGPLLGYVDPGQLVVLEASRDKLRAAHTYGDATPNPNGLPATRELWLYDGGRVSRAGAQLDVVLTTPALDSVAVVLTAPDGRSRRWTALGSGTAAGARFRLYAPAMAGAPCTGRWTIVATGASGSLDLVQLFVEGIGLSGLGGDLFDWGVVVDPALAGKNGIPVDLAAAQTAIERIKHAHTKGHILRSVVAIPDDALTIPDQFVPG